VPYVSDNLLPALNSQHNPPHYSVHQSPLLNAVVSGTSRRFHVHERLIHTTAVASMTAQVVECLLGLKAEKHLDRERALRKFQELISQSGEHVIWVPAHIHLHISSSLACSHAAAAVAVAAVQAVARHN
jgi:hypothetical protein